MNDSETKEIMKMEANHMIKHIVMFKLKENALGKTAYENALEAKRRFEEISGKIPTLRKYEVGVNAKDAPASNYEFALVCEFDDIDGLNAYQVHPEHLNFGKFIAEIKEERACIDYEF